MPPKEKKNFGPGGLIGELLFLANSGGNNDRRSEKRFPFFRPVLVQVDDHSFSAFTREISAVGMGLLHYAELPLKEVVINIAGRQLRVRIERCQAIGEGWYISGGTLVDMNA